MLVLGAVLLIAAWLLAVAGAGWRWRGPFTPTPAYMALMVSGVALTYSARFLARRETKRARQTREQSERQFLADLKRIADDLTMSDPEDELGDLLVIYDEAERRDLLARLQRLPKGLRKLRTVVDQMDREG